MLKNPFFFLKNNLIFTISFFLAIICCYFGRVSINFIDLKVIIILFSLMLIVESLKETNIINNLTEIIISYSKTKRKFVQSLIILSFVSAMLFTNDVAVLALLPIFLLTSKKNFSSKESTKGTVLIILAANLGSSVSPTGNPQNIFIFSHYHLSFITFLTWIFPFFILSIICLLILSYLIPNDILKNNSNLDNKANFKIDVKIVIALIIMMGYITNIISSPIVVIIAIFLAIFTSLNSLKKIDYKLLLIFIFFFLIVGNLSENQFLSDIISSKLINKSSTLWISATVSQFISNVPAAILLAPFTNDAHNLIIGTNIGGMGTLVASLANLIGFNIFKTYEPTQKKHFLKVFSLINFGAFIIFLLIFILLI